MIKDIYEVNEKIGHLLDKYMDEDGVLAPEISDQLEALGLEKEDLISGLAMAVKNNQLLIDGIGAEIKRLQSRKKAKENGIYWLTKQVRDNISAGERIETAEFKIRWTTSTVVDIDEFVRDPYTDYHKGKFTNFIKKKIEYSYMKIAIQRFLSVEGAKLEGMKINKTKNLKIS